MINNTYSGIRGFFYVIWNQFKSIFRIPPQLKLLFNGFSQYGDGGPTVPRALLKSGRCDNIQWIEKTGDGKSGTCESAIRPRDLIWTLDTQLNPEFSDTNTNGGGFIAYAAKNKIDTQQWLNNTNVVIPWDRSPTTTFFVPQCEEAYFAKQCRVEPNSKKCEKTEHWANGYCCIKANLLKEQGLTCGLKTFALPSAANFKITSKNKEESPSFNDIKYRNKKPPTIAPTGSPTFKNIISGASGTTSAFLNSQ